MNKILRKTLSQERGSGSNVSGLIYIVPNSLITSNKAILYTYLQSYTENTKAEWSRSIFFTLIVQVNIVQLLNLSNNLLNP